MILCNILGEHTSEVFKTSGEKSAETVGDTVSNLGQAKSLADISNVFTFSCPIYCILFPFRTDSLWLSLNSGFPLGSRIMFLFYSVKIKASTIKFW